MGIDFDYFFYFKRENSKKALKLLCGMSGHIDQNNYTKFIFYKNKSEILPVKCSNSGWPKFETLSVIDMKKNNVSFDFELDVPVAWRLGYKTPALEDFSSAVITMDVTSYLRHGKHCDNGLEEEVLEWFRSIGGLVWIMSCDYGTYIQGLDGKSVYKDISHFNYRTIHELRMFCGNRNIRF